MRHPPSSADRSEHGAALERLKALGFGPDTVLMNDPKLFVDGRFLASLLVELEEELGPDEAALALFEIGLLHGLRDAARLCGRHDAASPRSASPPRPEPTSLVMDWRSLTQPKDGVALVIEGRWPERHEAVARCSRVGPCTRPSCWMSAGYTSGWLSGALDASLIVRETECAAMGAKTCRFEVRDALQASAVEDERIQRLLLEIPFESFRRVAASPPVEAERPLPDPAAASAVGRFDRSQAVVHIWGPVMVLPFTTLDEALGTVDMLGRDPGIGEIRAVVIDLREQPLDEGFGAAALEQILETVESWQAQSLITGVALSAEAAIASLEASHLVLRKDLSEAIATAFQIADAQRHRV